MVPEEELILTKASTEKLFVKTVHRIFFISLFFLRSGRNALSSKETGQAQGDWRDFCCMFVCYIQTIENRHLIPNIFKVVLNVYLFK